MKNLPDGYQTLTFNQITKKITKTFKLKENAKISEDLELYIRIKESQGKIMNINGQQFKTQYDFSTTIPKNTGLDDYAGESNLYITGTDDAPDVFMVTFKTCCSY